MGPEPRSRADQGQPGANPPGEEPRARPEPKVKSFEIGKRLIYAAWEKVRANAVSRFPSGCGHYPMAVRYSSLACTRCLSHCRNYLSSSAHTTHRTVTDN